MSNDLKVRYSDEDLQEFKDLIDLKIVKADEELAFSQQQIAELNENGFNQQGGDWYDDTGSHTDMEMLQRMVVRQQKHVQDLKNALLRIKNKTYGICTVSGQLIDKKRLLAVPHATKTVDAKNQINSSREHIGENTGHSDPLGMPVEETKPVSKPTSDKVRLPNVKSSRASGEDWEPDNDNIEDTNGYNGRKNDDDDDM